eukprot:CAMPEP_0174266268 /NCGR_PEP_ID=MMETSP0439-20130205/29542_1 /TAXON_ID=0 /ORGANISM="Stereomyxa ramosa, Strain Chinc5" /LENGTH=55 /DNA_ID=CAMNT_0015353123 /DNA_START=83 /DNA_END=250 /DNA_ORIENTATION=+
MTIEEVKRKICEIEGLSMDAKQRLIFDGMEVHDKHTVGECAVKKGDTLHLVRKKR